MNPALQLFCKHKRPHAVGWECMLASDWWKARQRSASDQSKSSKQKEALPGKKVNAKSLKIRLYVMTRTGTSTQGVWRLNLSLLMVSATYDWFFALLLFMFSVYKMICQLSEGIFGMSDRIPRITAISI